MSTLFIPGTNINIFTNVEQFHKIDVSPSVAKWLLGRSRGNGVRAGKGIRQEWLKTLQGIIARGEWQACHQGGALDWNGTLFDGHHRLTAISLQEQTLPMWFKIGCNPSENMVIDQGAVRTTADVLSLDKKLAETLRLAAFIHYKTRKPSSAQISTLLGWSPLVDAHQAIHDACPRAVTFFSSSPMRLAACLRIIDGSPLDFVATQWRSLILGDYSAMSRCAQALTKQVHEKRVRVGNTYDTLARGLVVFDDKKQLLTKIQVKDAMESVRYAKAIFLRIAS